MARFIGRIREGLVVNAVTAGLALLMLAIGATTAALFLVALVVVTDLSVGWQRRVGRHARRLLTEETRIACRIRPVGVSVDFDNMTDPVPCEVVADPEGEVDEHGDPLQWVARPVRVPEGAERIISYSVAVWPSGHGIALAIDGLDELKG